MKYHLTVLKKLMILKEFIKYLLIIRYFLCLINKIQSSLLFPHPYRWCLLLHFTIIFFQVGLFCVDQSISADWWGLISVGIISCNIRCFIFLFNLCSHTSHFSQSDKLNLDICHQLFYKSRHLFTKVLSNIKNTYYTVERKRFH